jgi:uncharacterized membrane protein YccC
MGLRFDASQIESFLTTANDRFNAALDMYSETACKKLQSDARANAKWKDRTGDARKRLTGYRERRHNGIRLVLAHGVDYGLWLELAHEQRYAILQQTVNKLGPEILRGLDRLMERMKGT